MGQSVRMMTYNRASKKPMVFWCSRTTRPKLKARSGWIIMQWFKEDQVSLLQWTIQNCLNLLPKGWKLRLRSKLTKLIMGLRNSEKLDTNTLSSIISTNTRTPGKWVATWLHKNNLHNHRSLSPTHPNTSMSPQLENKKRWHRPLKEVIIVLNFSWRKRSLIRNNYPLISFESLVLLRGRYPNSIVPTGGLLPIRCWLANLSTIMKLIQ